MDKTPRYIADLSRFCVDVASCQINEQTYYACANVLFYTSCYEEWLFSKDKQQSPNNTEVIANALAGQLDLTQYDAYGKHFCQRYLTAGKTNTKFKGLDLRGPNAPKVETALKEFQDHQVRDAQLLWAYLMIAYRFRNNMFHGNKKLKNINRYAEEFEILNRFWDQFLRDIHAIGYNGFKGKTNIRRKPE